MARERPRESGLSFGIYKPGKLNAITDVPGVRVGHTTLVAGDSVRTGVTAILPHSGNLFQEKVPAAIYIGNGFGKLAGYSQVEELGSLETPIVLTNTLSVATAVDALITYTLNQPGNEDVRSVNAVVGETNDGYLNEIRRCAVTAGCSAGSSTTCHSSLPLHSGVCWRRSPTISRRRIRRCAWSRAMSVRARPSSPHWRR